MTEGFLWAVFILGGFLFGSVMFCSLLPKTIAHINLSEISDDGNPGAFNVFRHCGAKLGIPCLLLDLLKGFLPVFLAGLFTDRGSWLFAAVIVAPVLGHAIGMFNRFRGGKCIATAFGVTAGLIPATFVFFLLAALYILFSTIVKITPNRRRSIAVFTLFGVGAFLILIAGNQFPLAAGCALISIVANIKHLIPSARG